MTNYRNCRLIFLSNTKRINIQFLFFNIFMIKFQLLNFHHSRFIIDRLSQQSIRDTQECETYFIQFSSFVARYRQNKINFSVIIVREQLLTNYRNN